MAELSVGNVVRRVLHAIKEEFTAVVQEDPELCALYKPSAAGSCSASMFHLLKDASSTASQSIDMSQTMARDLPFKSTFIQAINELIDELESLYVNISNQAIEHIHSNELIMTIGKSKTVEEFFRAAHRKRKFQVVVAETGPSYVTADD
jgi:translation initiation factor eIF-2B subunit beta